MTDKIIKAEDQNQVVSLNNRLNFDESATATLLAGRHVIHKEELADLKKAKSILKDAEQKAQLVKSKARELYLEVEERVKQASAEGFSKGKEAGLAQVTEQLVRLEKFKQDLMVQLERDAVKLVYDIAQKVIGDSLVQSEEAIVGLVQQALRSALGRELTIFLNPSDYDRVSAHEAKLAGLITAVQTLHLKPSERVKPGGCVIESELGTIEAELDHQLKAIKAALDLALDQKDGF